AFAAAEAAMQAWQQRWEAFTREGHEAGQKAMVERARIEHLDGGLRRTLVQQEKVQVERDELASQDASAAIAALAARDAAAAAEDEKAQAHLKSLLDAQQALRDGERQLQADLDRARQDVAKSRGQVVSIEALQQAALGQAKGKVVDWLRGHALGERPRLAQELSVERGWSRAVETVLGSYLEAVCVDGLDAVAAMVGDLTVGQVTFIGGGGRASAAPDRLLGKVKGPAALDQLLGGVYAVEHLGEALSRRATLKSGESIITRDGVWIGREWLRVSRDQDAHGGVLEREQELRTRREELKTAEAALAARERELAAARERLAALDAGRNDAQEAANRLHRAHVEVRGQLESAKARADQGRERVARLATEAEELAAEIRSAQDETRAARARLSDALEAMQACEARRPELESERERLREALGAARAGAESERSLAQEAAIAVESKRSTLASLTTSLERVRGQLEQLAARRTELERELSAGEEPLAAQQRELETLLTRKLDSERGLAIARAAVETAEAQFRALDADRIVAEGNVESARQEANAAALAAQETRVRRESVAEQFAAMRFELDAVLAGLAPEANAQQWELNLTEVEGKIERLGQVNLAAIDEFKEQSERKEYLDRQFGDLTEALNTLEQAIRKIDRETRQRFQETFDQVNAGLKDKFPRLFGGGHAYLELIGEDVLAAGVAVMARPPGKRNVTISQLSGGEKALTAVALVFSIFELNPAPFCLLDEVDAPLDDHNVGRFCDIVRDMSERVQFVFITHNKNTMELARQLVGVTMNEPGVSRLVSVDVDEALRMAAAG
ncbi:MAG TPA: chromosome segregation protein SMC, partial [Casimicrobiaceae bacterium]|nr:chromosome segregation protein SMC [Casimicrobiaceae bacterium]